MPSADNKRIAKNTLMLYFRMAVSMIVTLYTSRVVLQTLGIDDYGLWSVVGTLVVLISFITGPMSSATQRFVNCEIGKGNLGGVSKIFNESLIINCILGVIIIILLETVGLWFLNNKMDIPQAKMFAANCVYQFSIASFVLSILRMSYDAMIIAHERFNFYAVMGIVEVTLKLMIVWLLPFAPDGETLIFYAFLYFLVTAINSGCYVVYCRRYYEAVKIKWTWDKKLLREMVSFSAWSTFGAFATVSGNQGLSILFNVFFGLSVNAAVGISNQVLGAINVFVNNFQTAFRPQIVKTYAADEKDATFRLMCMSSKVSCFLIFLLGLPMILNVDYVLSVWLTEVPPLTAVFCRITIVIAIVEAVSAPLWMIVQADGHIRQYQIVISSLYLCTIIVSYFLFRAGCSAPWAFVAKLAIVFVCLLVRVLFVKRLAGFRISGMVRSMIMPECYVMAISLVAPLVVSWLFPENTLTKLLLTSTAFIVTFVPAVLFVGLKAEQRNQLLNCIFRKR